MKSPRKMGYAILPFWFRLRRIQEFFLLALLLTGAAQAEVAVPPLTRRVVDITATLDAQQTQTLESRLAAFETKKGAQLAVLIIPTTQPETIEQFGMRVAEAWKLGRKGVDDGVLLLVAKNDRKLRIEVGYGLEGALNDATAKRIIAEIITPFFKRGEFYAGVDAGTSAMIRVIDGEPLPPPQKWSSEKYELSDLVKEYFMWIFLGTFVSALILGIMLGEFLGGVANGILVGSIIWLMGTGLIISLVIGVLVFVMTVSFFRGGSGGDSSSSGGSGGFGGGGLSGGGFSGGGGGFGGGGASGSW